MDILYSLGGIFDAAIFIFYRDAEPITMFAQLRGKRVGMGVSEPLCGRLC
jgi:ABC-type nitrate/sulfonate/bicarbonate transport system substrate-binding protein